MAADQEDLFAMVQVRCGKTGQVTVALFSRTEVAAQFRIVKVLSSATTNREAIGNRSGTAAGAIPDFFAKLRSLVTRDTGDKEQSKGQGSLRTAAHYASDQFDWSGWYCPTCGHSQNAPASTPFFLCGQCHELICGFSAREIGPGICTVKCLCGGGGRITGKIESYDGHSVAPGDASVLKVASEPLPPPRAALPSSRAALPSSRKALPVPTKALPAPTKALPPHKKS